MAATLQLTREGFGIELRRGTFHILLDGKDVGSIQWHEKVEVPLEAGHHSLRVKAGRYVSRQRSFDARNEEVVNFRCVGANLWFIWLASFAKPDLGIALKRE